MAPQPPSNKYPINHTYYTPTPTCMQPRTSETAAPVIKAPRSALSPLSVNSYAKTGLLLGATKALIVPATQPFQVVMRHQQTALSSMQQILSAPQALVDILRNNRKTGGFPSSLFRGSVSAMTKEAVKNGTYKALLFKGAPKLISDKLSSPNRRAYSPIHQHLMISTLAAITAAAADTAFGGPFERYATYRATSQGQRSNASFVEELRGTGSKFNQFKFLYKGAGATATKTGIACLALFGFASPIQQWTNQAYGLKPGDNIPLSASGITALLTGTAVAVCSSPFDIVKTIHQMPCTKDDGSTLTVLKNNIKHFGLRGVTAGLPIKIGMTVIGWGAVSAITQQTKTVQEEGRCLHRFSPG